MAKSKVNAISKGRAAKGQREQVSAEWQEHDTLPLSGRTFYQAASAAELARERLKGRNKGRSTFMDGGKVKKMKGGGLAMLSPAYALAKSLESGEAEGLMKLSPLAQAMSAGRKNKEKAASVGSVTGMKSGGKVRGGGAATKGLQFGKNG